MDGFNDRVGKVFDCLSSKGGAAWSLSDAQIQRQTWNRDKGNKSSDIIINNKVDDETLVSSSFDNLFKQNKSKNKKKKNKNTFDDPDEDDDDDDDERIDDLDVRSSIGLDPTLDFEVLLLFFFFFLVVLFKSPRNAAAGTCNYIRLHS
jgi:hypothetical protein